MDFRVKLFNRVALYFFMDPLYFADRLPPLYLKLPIDLFYSVDHLLPCELGL